MRKLVILGLLALCLSLISTALFAGYPACDDMKSDLKDARIYGWCNAWHSADTQEEKDQIEARILERIEGIEIDLPWLDDDGGDFCPCWGSFTDLEDQVACAGYAISGFDTDTTVNGTGYDSVSFGTSPLAYNPGLAMWAGFTFINGDEYPECIFAKDGGIQAMLPTGNADGSDDDAVCRLHILDLISSPPSPDPKRCDP